MSRSPKRRNPTPETVEHIMSTQQTDPTQYGPPSDGARDLAHLLREALKEMRSDPPPLPTPVRDAIAAYAVLSGALNPVPASQSSASPQGRP